jgi:NADPH-dependent curcumin reductase
VRVNTFPSLGSGTGSPTISRVVVCGLIAEYNDVTPTAGPDIRSVLTKRLTVGGFIITDHSDRLDDFLRDVSAWSARGGSSIVKILSMGCRSVDRAFARAQSS